VDASALAYWPAGQTAQAVAPPTAEAVPFGHGVHSPLDAADVRPVAP